MVLVGGLARHSSKSCLLGTQQRGSYASKSMAFPQIFTSRPPEIVHNTGWGGHGADCLSPLRPSLRWSRFTVHETVCARALGHIPSFQCTRLPHLELSKWQYRYHVEYQAWTRPVVTHALCIWHNPPSKRPKGRTSKKNHQQQQQQQQHPC